MTAELTALPTSNSARQPSSLSRDGLFDADPLLAAFRALQPASEIGKTVVISDDLGDDGRMENRAMPAATTAQGEIFAFGQCIADTFCGAIPQFRRQHRK